MSPLLLVSAFLCIIRVSQSTKLKLEEDRIIKRALQKSHEKSREQKWSDAFIGSETFDQQNSLVDLVRTVSEEYLTDCSSLVLYDNSIDGVLLSRLLQAYPMVFLHGKINDKYTLEKQSLLHTNVGCINFVLFIRDVMRSRDVIGDSSGKVLIVAASSQWRVSEFLSSESAQDLDNLLVVVKSDKTITGKKVGTYGLFQESPYILYTHHLYTDALGSSQPRVLTSWILDRFTRKVNLYPKKIVTGFSGHRFIVSVAHQPPYVIKRERDNSNQRTFDGREIRMLKILSEIYNFTTDFREASDDKYAGAGKAVASTIKNKKADMGLAGLYISSDRLYTYGIFQWHSQDCAAFISLTSTALPKYQAIMGPFHWSVWVAITSTYLGAILLFEFSDKLTLKHLLSNPEKVENMFWYVFGTFTNCFTFVGKSSWSKAENAATKQLIGFFWLFTIIITACYTGSIIAFITIPVFPESVDSISQLLDGGYEIGLLDKGGWETWFQNVTDIESIKLMKRAEPVPSIELGLKNVTKAFFWPYAFLASEEQLAFIVKTNFTTTSKRSVLHISDRCFALFNVGILFPKKSIYAEVISEGILRIVQSGLLVKINNDIEWSSMRSATGKLLAANSRIGSVKALSYEDRALNLDDTTGMFLLLAIGFTLGGSALVFEVFGGYFDCCKKQKPSSASTLKSNPRSHERQTHSNYFKIRKRSSSVSNNNEVLESATFQNHGFGSEVFIERNKREEIGENDSDSELDFNEEINKIFEDVFIEDHKPGNSRTRSRDNSISSKNSH